MDKSNMIHLLVSLILIFSGIAFWIVMYMDQTTDQKLYFIIEAVLLCMAFFEYFSFLILQNRKYTIKNVRKNKQL